MLAKVRDKNWKKDRTHLAYVFFKLNRFTKDDVKRVISENKPVQKDARGIWFSPDKDIAMLKFRLDSGGVIQDLKALAQNYAQDVRITNYEVARTFQQTIIDNQSGYPGETID